MSAHTPESEYHYGIIHPDYARLIAAAPEMLEVLQLVLAWFDAEHDHSTTEFMQRVEMCVNAEAQIRAVIAKATGVDDEP